MVPEKVYRAILRVVEPFEGTAFLVAPGIAVSALHVSLPVGADTDSENDVLLEYWFGRSSALRIKGRYLPRESNPGEDLAVLVFDPAVLEATCLPLSQEYEAGEDVCAVGFPFGTQDPRPIRGQIQEPSCHWVKFEDDARLEVLVIGTGGIGFWTAQSVHSGMSGGPIWNLRRGAVIGVVEGRTPREGLQTVPEGYGILIKHLRNSSVQVREGAHWVGTKMDKEEGGGDPCRSSAKRRKSLRRWVLLATAGIGVGGLLCLFGVIQQCRPMRTIDILAELVSQTEQAVPFTLPGSEAEEPQWHREGERLVITYTELKQGQVGIEFPLKDPVIVRGGGTLQVIMLEDEFPGSVTLELKDGARKVTYYDITHHAFKQPVQAGTRFSAVVFLFSHRLVEESGRITVSEFRIEP